MRASHVTPAGSPAAKDPTATDQALAAAMRDALRHGDALTPGVLDAASALGARLRGEGRSRDAISVAVRRALSVAAPPAMTASAFEPIARALIAHASRERADARRTADGAP